MDNAILIKEAKNGSAAAQKCLFNLFADKMMIVCRRYLKSKEDAEEILIDGFCRFFKSLSKFNYENDAALYGWLKRIMVNECLMFLRKKNIFSLSSESVPEDFAAPEATLSNLTANEIFNLVVLLPTGYRTVFNLFAIEGMPHKEISVLMNISEGTSKSQLNKARALLQKMLVQKGIEYGAQKTK